MKHIVCLILIFVSVNSLASTKAANLNKLWDFNEKTHGYSQSALDSFRKWDPERGKALSDPNLQNQIKTTVRNRWMQLMDKSFTESEVEYLLKLYTSPFVLKLIQVNKDVWNKDLIHGIIEQGIKAAPAAKSAPSK